MVIGGRIIKDKLIFISNDCEFRAKYKNHDISVSLVKLGHTNGYYIEVHKLTAKGYRRQTKAAPVPAVLEHNLNRCTLREAVIYALEYLNL